MAFAHQRRIFVPNPQFVDPRYLLRPPPPPMALPPPPPPPPESWANGYSNSVMFPVRLRLDPAAWFRIDQQRTQMLVQVIDLVQWVILFCWFFLFFWFFTESLLDFFCSWVSLWWMRVWSHRKRMRWKGKMWSSSSNRSFGYIDYLFWSFYW